MKKLSLFLLLTLSLACTSTQAIASVGVATTVTGHVTLTHDHQVFILEKGVDVDVQDEINTGSDSHAQLDMDDGSILYLSSNSTMRLSTYAMRDDHSVASAMVDMVSGWMRFAVAKLQHRDSQYRFKMTTAVLGVRGTEGLLNVEGNGTRAISSLLLKTGKVDVSERILNGKFAGGLVTLTGGEFASRKDGFPLKKLSTPPARFVGKIPSGLKSYLKPGDKTLRGVKPKPVLSQLPMTTPQNNQMQGLTMLPNPNLSGGSAEGALFKIFKQGDKPRVKAELSYAGSGVLQGVWEIAEPSSTVGTPAFHTLKHVRKFLNQFGQVTIYSPHLPSNATGLYMVRFRITDPAPAFDTPVIRYFVNASKGISSPKHMDLITPGNRALISDATRFSWENIPTAHAYLLELFSPAAANPGQPAINTGSTGIKSLLIPTNGIAGKPLSGMLISANQTALSQLVRSHLEQGHGYLWRVKAIGPSGHVIGESPLRLIQVP